MMAIDGLKKGAFKNDCFVCDNYNGTLVKLIKKEVLECDMYGVEECLASRRKMQQK
jgi:hypothetical protein